MPTLREVLARLGAPAGEGEQARRAAAALAAAEREGAPWFVNLFVGCGTWIGAVILAFFLGATNLLDRSVTAIALGVVLLAGAALVSRRLPHNVFFLQLTWVLAIGGEAAVLAGLAQIKGLENGAKMITWAAVLLQLVALAAIPQRLFRLFSTLALAGALTALPLVYRIPAGVNPLAVALAAALVALWIYEPRLCASRWGGLWHAGAYGLAAGLAIPLAVLLARDLVPFRTAAAAGSASRSPCSPPGRWRPPSPSRDAASRAAPARWPWPGSRPWPCSPARCPA